MTRRLTTPEIDEKVRERFQGKGTGSYQEVRDFLEELGVSIGIGQVEHYLYRRKIRLGAGDGRFQSGNIPWNKGVKMSESTYAKIRMKFFSKGHRPWDYKPVGTERINCDGYREVKIADPDKWKAVSRVVWEQHHGEIAKNSVIIFLDGNPLNCDITNLAELTRSELARFNQCRLASNNPDLTKTGVLIAKIKSAVGKQKRQVAKHGLRNCNGSTKDG